MVEDILVNVTPRETRVAITASGVVQELLIEREANRGLVGNVYVGRVARVLPGMQSAFVDVGLERAAFLHVADIWGHGRAGRSAAKDGDEAGHPIERLLAEGEPVLVQVAKDPIGTKGARLTTQVSLAGRLLVYLPASSEQNSPHIGISQRIEDEGGRQLLRERLRELVPADEKGGFIVRTLAEAAADEELRGDIDYLRNLWSVIWERSRGAKPPERIYQDLSLSQRVLRDIVTTTTGRVVIDSRETYQKLAAFAETYMPSAQGRLEHYTGERPLFDFYNVEAEIEKALSRRVDLKSGGTLVIDQTEALTTIDVNTGGFVGARNFDDTIFKTNLEAGQAIARQLRLRNLGGIIIIDFIDMAREEHQAAVLAELKKQLARDRTRITVSGFTQLGLVEMTRKRTRESLAHLLCEPCPTCQGRGEVKTARSVCHDILREILREARQFNPKEFRVLASAAVVEMLLDEESQHLAGLSDFIGKPISLRAEPFPSPEQYDIVLL
jgi:ribonuclease G